MSKVFPATLICAPGEPCFNLSELNRLCPPPDQKHHRYQVIIVVRNDSLAEYTLDLGPAGNFTRPEFRIPGGVTVGKGRVEILHTVQELQEIAEYIRNTRFELPFVPRDLAADYYNYIEQVPKLLKHKSTFGPMGRLLR